MNTELQEIIKDLEELVAVAPIKYLNPVVMRLNRAIEFLRGLEDAKSNHV
jgi:hypothetical protein